MCVSSVLLPLFLAMPASAQMPPPPEPAQAQGIAKEAFIYGFPMVENYKTIFAFALYKDNPQYKGPINTIVNEANVYTPADTTVVTPNSDTPYSFVTADLRAEPVVLGVPPMEASRYFSIQFVDLYTYNFDYVGSRATGNGGGKFLLAGPSWKGKMPKGIAKVIRSETDFALAIYRTQLFNPADIENVRKIQAGYTLQTLSQFLGTAPPPAPAAVEWPVFSPEKAKSLDFYNYLGFLLQYCPMQKDDEKARAAFQGIGIWPGKPFEFQTMLPDMNQALRSGMADGMSAIDAKAATEKSAADLFGTRAFMKNDYLNRAVGAKVGIYGNSKEEASYFTIKSDASGAPLNCASNRYTVHFAKGDFPPVKAFWSLTMYDGRTQFLVANPINRYLINSPMLPSLKLDADGGLTIYIQKDSPGADKEANWLPAPDGPVYTVFRCYWPEKPILDGKWQPPGAVRVQ